MRKKHTLMLLSWLLLALMPGLLPTAAAGDERLTDGEKKKVVYKMYEDYRKEFPNVRDMSPEQAMQEMAHGNIVFVDTRKPAEISVSMLPGAVTQEEFLKDPSRYQGKHVVAYCTISYRSGKFAQKMAEKGIQIFNLKGGLLAWVLEGGDVYDEKGVTKRINVYGEKWNYPPEGYESVVLDFFERYF